MTQENELHLCPKGCGRDDFKSKSAAGAHAKHCKFEPEPDPGSDGLTPSEQAILDRLAGIAGALVNQGMAGLEQRVLASIADTLPAAVAQETQNMAGKIAEEMKGNPGGGTPGGASLMSFLPQINAFLSTPTGKLVEQWLTGKRGGSVSTPWLFRGANYAQRMMMSKKTDMEGTAQFILATCEDALKERSLDPDYKAFLTGQKNTAKIALGAKASGKPKGVEEEG